MKFSKIAIIIIGLLTIPINLQAQNQTPDFGPARSGFRYEDHRFGYKSTDDPFIIFNSYLNFQFDLGNNKTVTVDERKFFWPVQRTTSMSSLYDTLDVIDFNNPQNIAIQNPKDGDVFTFWTYVHNNAAPGVNNEHNISGKSVAKDTKLKVELGSGKGKLTSKATISASNSEPKEIWANANINLGNTSDEFELSPIADKAAFYIKDSSSNSSGSKNWFKLTPDQFNQLFSSGVSIGSETGNLPSGLFNSCSPESIFVVFEAELKKKEAPPKVCRSLKFIQKEVKDGEICAKLDADVDQFVRFSISGKGKLSRLGSTAEEGTSRSFIDSVMNSQNQQCAQISGSESNTVVKIAVIDKIGGTEIPNTVCKDEVKAKSLVCTGMTFSKTPSNSANGTKIVPGEYCVKVTPENSYTGDMDFEIANGKLVKIEQKASNDSFNPIGFDFSAVNKVTIPMTKSTAGSASDKTWCATVESVDATKEVKLTIKPTDSKQPATCKLELKNSPTPLVCTGMKFSETPSNSANGTKIVPGKYCVKVTPENSYDGFVTFKMQNSGSFLGKNSYANGKLNLFPALQNSSPQSQATSFVVGEINPVFLGTNPSFPDFSSEKIVAYDPVNKQWCVEVYKAFENSVMTVAPSDTSQPAVCKLELKNSPIPPQVCRSLEFIQREVKDGEICAKLDAGADQFVRFSISGKGKLSRLGLTAEEGTSRSFIDSVMNSQNQQCAQISGSESNTVVKIAVIDRIGGTEIPNTVCKDEVKAKFSGQVCRTMTFAKRPNSTQIQAGEYCVSVDPATSYKGPVTFEVTTQFGTNTQVTPKTVQSPNAQNQWCANLTASEINNTTRLTVRPTDAVVAQTCNQSMRNLPTPPPPPSSFCASTTFQSDKTPNFAIPVKQEICIDARDNRGNTYQGPFQWFINGPGKFTATNSNTITTYNNCVEVEGLQLGSSIYGSALYTTNNACYFSTGSTRPNPPGGGGRIPWLPREDRYITPKISKSVRRVTEPTYSTRATIPFSATSGSKVQYRINYDFFSPTPVNVVINDTINKGEIKGTRSGRIENAQITEVRHAGRSIPHCDQTRNRPNQILVPCYEGNMNLEAGVIIIGATANIEVYYTAEVKSTVDDESCQDMKGECGERFINRASGSIISPVSTSPVPNPTTVTSNPAEVLVPCRYFLTRAGGDVFFQSEFGIGVDAQYCGRRSTTGIILKEIDQKNPIIPKTGANEIKTFSHKTCQLSGITKDSELYIKNKDEIEKLPESYRDPITDFSSLICEIQIATASSLNKDFIKASVEENITRLSRWNENLKDIPTLNNQSFTFGNLINQSVLRKKGALTINGLDISKFTEAEQKQFGAKTIIVEGDLTITGDIKYPELTNITNPREVPSLAFIVIGGDIKVAPDVTELGGVYFVREKEDKGGKITPTEKNDQPQTSDKQLTISGQVFGDIKELFQYRNFVGDPRRDEGAITIFFDQRIILNTPPGLEQIISLEQFETAR